MDQVCGCDSTNTIKKAEKDGYVYYRCLECGNLFGVKKEED